MSILAKDHTGQRFKSIAAMARAWGVLYCNLISRLDAGWTIERALTEPPKLVRKEWKGPKGERTKTLGELCSIYKIRTKIVANRLYSGWDLEEALTLRCPRRKMLKK